MPPIAQSLKPLAQAIRAKMRKKSEMKTLNKELKSKYKEILTEVRLGHYERKIFDEPKFR